MGKKVKVLYAVAECGPYGKTGGLGEVGEYLPEALKAEGVDICRVLPLYRMEGRLLKYKTDFPVPMGERYQTCTVKYDPMEKRVSTYFIGNDYYFNREGIYGHIDDGERFLFFCKSVIEMTKRALLSPDVIHCNDWHTGFIPFLIKTGENNIKTVFTIHNLRYHGWIPADYIREVEIKEEDLKSMGYPESLNFMKAGILYSDFITTVSPGYAGEILTPKMGGGMEKLLLKRKGSLRGILNGVDTENYNPGRPEDLYIPYTLETIKDKKKNKVLLKRELGLKDGDLPLVCSITRLDEQKGIDVIIEAIRKMNMKGFQFMIMGSGNMYYEELLKEVSEKYKGQMTAVFKYDPAMARKIYGGSDIFVMPSRYEPGGLGQLYAMIYGTVPVVRKTGGLKDTVIDMDDDMGRANGFCFEELSAAAFTHALKRAINAYYTQEWNKLVQNGMAADRSWRGPAAEYLEIYRRILEG